MRIALIRHTPPLIEAGICYGRLDVAADQLERDPRRWDHRNGQSRDQTKSWSGIREPGRTEIALAAERVAIPKLPGATRVWSSPARRCRVLADAIALARAVPLTVDFRLRELDFGEWEGRSWDAIPRADLDRWAACPLTFAPPRGESGAELIARISDFHAELRRDQQDCVVVSHGGPLKLLAALLSGRPPDLLAAAPPMGQVEIVTCAAADPSA
jgi:alpha-ribazole phosphatase